MSAPLLLATSNAGKLREFRDILGSSLALAGTADAPFSSTTAPDVPELGDTYWENALAKALGYQRVFRVPVLVDDSGLEVDVLGGAPGVHSATFGGKKISWPERWRKLHEALVPFPPASWHCRFRTVLCYYDGSDVPVYFQGTCDGTIVPSPAGGGGFGYDPIVRSADLGVTFGEATEKDKARVSARARAAERFLAWWRQRSR